MNTPDLVINLLVDQTPQEVFAAINDARGWWTTNFEGHSEKLNDVFTVRFGETWMTMKLVEFMPDKKVVWLVTDCNKHWLKDKKEWKDTRISWEISQKDNKTQIHFTHLGLIPKLECYDACENAWGDYIKGSLFKLITEGKGTPD